METPPQNESPPKPPLKLRFFVGLLGFLLGFSVFAYILGSECLRHIPDGKSYGQHHLIGYCMTNQRGLQLAGEMYAVENQDRYPPNLDVLDAEDYLQENHFTCPAIRSKNTESTSTNRDYVYCLCSQSNELPEPLLSIYELPINHYQEYVNMTFSDGQAESLHENMNEFRQQLQAINDFLSSQRNMKP